DAAEQVGFFYVRNHGVAPELIERVYAESQRFLALPAAGKESGRINARHRGPDDPDVAAGRPLMGPNQWPAAMPELAPVLTAYSEAVMDCGRRLLRGFAVGLGLDPDFFRPRFAKPLARCSLIYSPPQPRESGAEQFGVAPHTDYGGLTLLSQDDTGGLQVRT